MSKNGEIYTTGKKFTLPPGLTGWTNSTSEHTLRHTLLVCPAEYTDTHQTHVTIARIHWRHKYIKSNTKKTIHTLQKHRDSVKIQIYPSHRDCSYTLEAQISHMHCRCTQRYLSHRLQTYTANTQRLQTRGVTAQSWSHDGVRRLEGDQPGQRLTVDPWTST